jgi:hypothetical protein
VLVKAASLAVLAVHDPVCPDADLLHPLLQRIQHGLGPGLGRPCTRRQAARPPLPARYIRALTGTVPRQVHRRGKWGT